MFSTDPATSRNDLVEHTAWKEVKLWQKLIRKYTLLRSCKIFPLCRDEKGEPGSNCPSEFYASKLISSFYQSQKKNQSLKPYQFLTLFGIAVMQSFIKWGPGIFRNSKRCFHRVLGKKHQKLLTIIPSISNTLTECISILVMASCSLRITVIVFP